MEGAGYAETTDDNFHESCCCGRLSVALDGHLESAQEEPMPKIAKPEYIQATAEGTSTQMGRMVSVNIIINEYSTVEDQKALIQAFGEKGNEGLNHALDKMKAKGRIAITGTLGYDLNYIRQFQTPDGNRRMRCSPRGPKRFRRSTRCLRR
jgi:hypothetical protein